jgi:DNA-directed RNA polymerase alpha subunit
MLDPSADLPDEIPIAAVRLPTRIFNALSSAGLRTLGEVRESSDKTLLSLQDLGGGSVRWLRERL